MDGWWAGWLAGWRNKQSLFPGSGFYGLLLSDQKPFQAGFKPIFIHKFYETRNILIYFCS